MAEVESDLPLVALDRVQIQQVLINLIHNGMEAMASTAEDRILRMRVHRMDGCDPDRDQRSRPGHRISRQGYSSHSSRRKSTGWAWGSRFAVRSSSCMADGYGQRRTNRMERRSSSRCRLKRKPRHDDGMSHIVFIVDDDVRIREALGRAAGVTRHARHRVRIGRRVCQRGQAGRRRLASSSMSSCRTSTASICRGRSRRAIIRRSFS